MADSQTLLVAAVLLLLISALSIRLRWLTTGGAMGAGALGLLAVAAFSWPGLLALLAPFLVATLLGKLPKAGGAEEGPRTLKQVAANGVPALLACVLALASHPETGALAFCGALAALGADTIATEIGTRYGGTPRHVLSGRRLARGESGGVTWIGTVASVLGACLAPAAFALAVVAGGRTFYGWRSLYVALMLAMAGWLAGLFDSILGATLQRKGVCSACGEQVETAVHCGVPVALARGRIAGLDNDAVNLLNGLAGAVLGVVLSGLFRR